MSFLVACVVLNFLAYYINGVSVTDKKTCDKSLQKITDRLFQ